MGRGCNPKVNALMRVCLSVTSLFRAYAVLLPAAIQHSIYCWQMNTPGRGDPLTGNAEHGDAVDRWTAGHLDFECIHELEPDFPNLRLSDPSGVNVTAYFSVNFFPVSQRDCVSYSQ